MITSLIYLVRNVATCQKQLFNVFRVQVGLPAGGASQDRLRGDQQPGGRGQEAGGAAGQDEPPGETAGRGRRLGAGPRQHGGETGGKIYSVINLSLSWRSV